jgi:hypothetical protein
MRDPQFTSLDAPAASKNSRHFSEVLLQDADQLIKRKGRCWFLTRVQKITPVSVIPIVFAVAGNRLAPA